MAKSSLGRLLDLVDNSCSEAPIEKQLITDLNYSIECDANMEKHKPSKTFKPSSIGGCERKIYFQLIDAPQDEGRRQSASGIGILESGTDRHERIQKAFCRMKENGIDCEYVDVAEYVKEQGLDYITIKSKQGMETKCYWADIPLSFLTDGIIKYKGKYYILEIKTMNSYKFLESKTIRDEHKDQGICYSAAFKIDDVIYLYENRETLDKKAFMFHVTEDMRQNLLNKTKRIKQCVREGVPPVAYPTMNICKYCDYKTECKKYRH